MLQKIPTLVFSKEMIGWIWPSSCNGSSFKNLTILFSPLSTIFNGSELGPWLGIPLGIIDRSELGVELGN